MRRLRNCVTGPCNYWANCAISITPTGCWGVRMERACRGDDRLRSAASCGIGADAREFEIAARPLRSSGSSALFVACLSLFFLFFVGAANSELPLPPAQRTLYPPEQTTHAHPLAGDGDEAELACLAEAVYYEARSEGVYGQIAVAEVILNRRDHPDFPDTICEVVHQGYDPRAATLHRCQFSYFCDGRPEKVTDANQLARIRAMLWNVVNSDVRGLTRGATHYHASYVSPSWARRMFRVTQIDTHVFYRVH